MSLAQPPRHPLSLMVCEPPAIDADGHERPAAPMPHPPSARGRASYNHRPRRSGAPAAINAGGHTPTP